MGGSSGLNRQQKPPQNRSGRRRHQARSEHQPQPSRQHRPGRAFFLLAWALLVVGMVLSSMAGMVWANHIETQQRDEMNDRLSIVKASLDAELRRIDDFMAAQLTLVELGGPMSNSTFKLWFERYGTVQRFPGSQAFGYIEEVPSGELAGFVAEQRRDPPSGVSIPPGTGVVPPGARSQYCLIRLAVFIHHHTGIPPLYDFCAPAPSGSAASPTMTALASAASSGRPAVIEDFGSIHNLLDFYPVYRTGTTPPTPAARRYALAGWVLGTFDTAQVVDAALVGERDMQITLWHTNAGEQRVRIGAGGTAGADAQPFKAPALQAPGDWSVSVLATASEGVTPGMQGVAVGLACLLVTLLLFALVRTMAGSRSKLLQRVDEKTEELRYQTLHDGLTGLANRALVLEIANQMLARSERGLSSMAALFIDVDDFKTINDTLGHATGDRVLIEVAARLTNAVRASDRVGRLGGDEFVVLAEDVGPPGWGDLEALAARILGALREPHVSLEGANHPPLHLSASIGIAVAHDGDASVLLRHADVALYEAKAAGKDRYVMFRREMQQAVHDRLEIAGDLREAIERHELFLVFQPVFDLQAMKVRALEALIRWRHPARGVLLPASFIPVAEETGLIVPIGRFVIASACAAAARWHAGGHLVGVAANVSGRQLDQPGLYGDVEAALSSSGLGGSFLTLEVTETQLMRDLDSASRRLAVLRNLGVRVAIDDFGTGFGSLDHLRRLPVDAIKIDRSFVAEMSTSAEAKSLVQSFISMGKALGIETLAEGIEERSQLAALVAEHCDEGQGFLLARPLEEAEVEPFLAAAGGFMVPADPLRGVSLPSPPLQPSQPLPPSQPSQPPPDRSR